MTTRQLALADPTSTYYHNVNAIIRRAMADRANAEESRRKVMLPFKVPPASVAEYEKRFGWKIVVENHGFRTAHTPHVGGLTYCMALRNLLCMGFDGEEVVIVDGDLPLIVGKGFSFAKVVRTASSGRLTSGYVLEDTQLERLAKSSNTAVVGAAKAVLEDLRGGGGGRVYVNPQDPSIRGDTVILDHTKTSMSLRQAVACATAWKASLIRGVCFFQVEMLAELEGPLSAFKGMYFIDEEKDVITYVPDEDPNTCFSHSWSALRSFFLNHECVHEGKTWMVEKHLGEKGIFHYAVRQADEQWQFATELGANYYSDDFTSWVELEYPTRGGATSGASSVYFRREKVRILKSLYEKTMAVMLSVEQSRLTREEVISVMRSYNNTSAVAGEIVRTPLRVSAMNEDRAATPMLAQVVYRRAAASAECAAALQALRTRYNVANEGVLSLFWEVCCKGATFISEVSMTMAFSEDAASLGDLVDGDVNMAVLSRTVPTSVEVRQVVGNGIERDCGRLTPGLPGHKPSFVCELLRRARLFTSGEVHRRDEGSVSESGGVPVEQFVGEDYQNLAGVSESVVDESEETLLEPVSDSSYIVSHTLYEPASETERQGLSKQLFDKLVAGQDAATFLRPPREVQRYENVKTMPPVEVKTVLSSFSAMQEDYDDGFPGVSMNDAEIVAHVATTEDYSVTRQAHMSINSAKREIAKPRRMRRSVCRAGAAGVLPNTQIGLLSALGKRNVDVPTNRESVDFSTEPLRAVRAIQNNCYVDGWKAVLERELNAGLWQPSTEDLNVYVGKVETSKAQAMLKEFFSLADVDMHRWLVMVKSKAKPPVDPGSASKVPIAQTIMYNESKSMNAMYSSIMSRFHDVLDMLFLPNVRFNDRASPAEHEVWFNSLEPLRGTCKKIYRYQGDAFNFDRSQELMALVTELCFYREHGLNEETLKMWSQTMGVKAAVSLMHGVIMYIVMQGLSGIFKTLMRNGIVTLASVVIATKIRKESLISLDIKGDDYTVETNLPVDVDSAVRTLAWTFNLSAKLWECDYLYFCSKYWLYIDGWWYWVADPERKFESLCAAVAVDDKGETVLKEKWISLRDDLRHYNNGVVVDELANAVMACNPRRTRPPLCLIGGLAGLAEDRDTFFSFYGPVEIIGL